MTICFACVEYFTLTAFSDRQLQLQDLEVRSSCPTQPKDSRVCLKLPLQRPTSLSDSIWLYLTSEHTTRSSSTVNPLQTHTRDNNKQICTKHSLTTYCRLCEGDVSAQRNHRHLYQPICTCNCICRSSWSPQFFKVKICWTALAISHN